MQKRLQLGVLLLQQGIITSAQLDAAIRCHQARGCRLGEALIALGFCTEVQVARALAEQIDMRFVDLAETPPTPQALELVPADLARECGAVPVRLEEDRLLVAARNAFDFRVDEMFRKASGRPVTIACALEAQVEDALRRYEVLLQGRAGSAPPLWETVPRAGRVSRPIPSAPPPLHRRAVSVDVLQEALAEAVRRGADALHVEPDETAVLLRARIGGALVRLAALPRACPPGETPPILESLWRVCDLRRDEASDRTATGRLWLNGQSIPVRARSIVALHGESIVLEFFPGQRSPLDFEALGLAPEVREPLLDGLLARPGLFLVVGPARSGKTTTLYALFERLCRDEVHGVTVEREITRRVAAARQLQVSVGRDTLAKRLAEALEQKPDLLLLGEIDGPETAALACEAAAEGRRLLAGIAAEDALGGIFRLLDFGVAPERAASALSAALGLRLARRICPACGTAADGEREATAPGCERCRYTGVAGAVGIQELLVVDEDLRALLARGVLPGRIRRFLARRGVRTLARDAAAKRRAGLIPPGEPARLGLADEVPPQAPGVWLHAADLPAGAREA